MKHLFKYLYFILVIFFFFIMANVAEVNKISNFFQDSKELMVTSDQALISGTIVGNYHDKTESYVSNTPLYEETFESETNQIRIAIYPLVQFKNDAAVDALAILITNLDIGDENVQFIDEETNLLFANIKFSEHITLNDKEVTEVTETFTNTYHNHTKLLIIQQDKISTEDGFAEYEKITISYQLTSGNDRKLVVIQNSDLTSDDIIDQFDVTYDRDTKDVTSDKINLKDVYGLSNYENEAALYYNPTFQESLQSYNTLYVRYMGIGLVIVIIVTYLLFFNKSVLVMIKLKKQNKQKTYEAIKKEMLETKDKE